MSSVKVQFEIGHEASRKTKISKDGFTHDWELFVRGADSNDISIFVDKVVFNIHESFPKPKRVFKEPPYSLKEAGYAGFVLPIDIYFKNRDEPKKVTFMYDLDLTPIKLQKEEHIFTNPTDEFRRKCLKGGGVIVSNISSDQKNRDSFSSKTTGGATNLSNDSKKHKRPDDTKSISNHLFIQPVKKPSSKVSPDPRVINSSPNPVKVQGGKGTAGEKQPSVSSSKDKDKIKHKHSGNKDGKESKKEERNASKSEESKSKKDKKDRERSKEKSVKRPTSPKRSPKRPTSPGSTQLPAAISRNSTSFNTSTGGKDKPQPKHQPITPEADKSNSTNKKSNKKDKKNYERDRERLDKKAQKESKKDISAADKKALFESAANKPGNPKERDSNKDEKMKGKVVPPEPKNPSTAADQSTIKKGDKHSDRKHKKEKKVKESSKDKKREKSEKSSSKNTSGNSRSIESTAIIAPIKMKEPKHEVATKMGAMTRLSDKDSSDSEADSPMSLKNDSDNSNSLPEPPKLTGRPEKGQKRSRDKAKPSAGDKEDKKRKRKVKDESPSSPPAKQMKKDNSPARERPSSSASISQPLPTSLTNNNHIEVNSTTQQPPLKISNDYMNELKELKNKITALKNNDELQYVVQLIASTGCYEITKSTFDFDLCLLDQKTVEKLQEFLNTNT